MTICAQPESQNPYPGDMKYITLVEGFIVFLKMQSVSVKSQ